VLSVRIRQSRPSCRGGLAGGYRHPVRFGVNVPVIFHRQWSLVRFDRVVLHSGTSPQHQANTREQNPSKQLHLHGLQHTSIRSRKNSNLSLQLKTPYFFICSERISSRNAFPLFFNFSSNFRVQSQSQHAHDSVPFSCRQFRREWASFTWINSKYSSQYGRSSSNGVEQKHVSTQYAVPSSISRACSMS
jgi:hypothetical protein